MANLDPRGIVGRIYEGDHLTLLHTKYLSSVPHDFREEGFLSFCHYKSMRAIYCHGNQNSNFFPYKFMRANEPRGMANLDPRGTVGRIYVGDHLTLLQTKYLSSGPHGFREEDFF